MPNYLYQQGYFRQGIDQNGAQQALFPYNDPGQLPISPLRHPNGEWLRLKIDLPGYAVWLRAWQVQVGRANATNVSQNTRAGRCKPHFLQRSPGIIDAYRLCNQLSDPATAEILDTIASDLSKYEQHLAALYRNQWLPPQPPTPTTVATVH